MNWKIVSAFAAGAVIASGIVYVAVKPQPTPRPLTVMTAVPPPPVVMPAAVAQPAPAEPVAAQPATSASAPVREKPSPMAPVVRKAPATAPTVAHIEEAQWHPPAPPPMTEPVNKERPYNDAKLADPPVPSQPEPQQATAPPPPVTATVREEMPQPSPPALPARGPNRVILLAGTVLPVRIGETISSAQNQKGDTFLATLDQALVIDGFIIAERGSRVEGRVVEAEAAGRGKGSSRLGIELVKLTTADGQYIQIRTQPFSKEGASNGGKDVATVAAGAAIGAAIGAAAGSGKGAAIGAGVGGAAGVADVLLTRGRPVEIRVETRISFRMSEAVTITERLN